MTTTQTVTAVTLATDSETYRIELTDIGNIKVSDSDRDYILTSAAELFEIAKVAARLEEQLDE